MPKLILGGYEVSGTSTNAVNVKYGITNVENAITLIAGRVIDVENKLVNSELITLAGGGLTMHVQIKNGVKQLWAPATAFTKSIAANSWVQIGTLDTAYRPTHTVYTGINLGGSTLGILQIDASGKILVYSTVALTTSWQAFFVVTYI